MGSVASPGRGSSKAAHMLLLRSNWTTLREGPEKGGPGSGAEGHGGVSPLPPLLGGSGGRPSPTQPSERLTPTRPNSQARSRGVFPELSTMHGLDWCCSSISDYGATARGQHPRWRWGPCRPGTLPPGGCPLPRRSGRAGLPGAEGCGPRPTGCSPLSPPSAPASWAPSAPARPHSAAAACLGTGGGSGGRWELALDPAPTPGLQGAEPRTSPLDPQGASPS